MLKIDLGKNLAGLDATGAVAPRRRMTREGLSAATLFAGSVSAQDSVSSSSASTSGPITYIGGDANLTAAVDTQVAAAIGQYACAANHQASIGEAQLLIKANRSRPTAIMPSEV